MKPYLIIESVPIIGPTLRLVNIILTPERKEKLNSKIGEVVAGLKYMDKKDVKYAFVMAGLMGIVGGFTSVMSAMPLIYLQVPPEIVLASIKRAALKDGIIIAALTLPVNLYLRYRDQQPISKPNVPAIEDISPYPAPSDHKLTIRERLVMTSWLIRNDNYLQGLPMRERNLIYTLKFADYAKIDFTQYEGHEDIICPISHQPMRQPVIAPDGNTYDLAWLHGWYMQGNDTCPCVPSKYLPNPYMLQFNKGMVEKIYKMVHAEQIKELDRKFQESGMQDRDEFLIQLMRRQNEEYNNEIARYQRLVGRTNNLEQQTNERVL